MSCADCHALSTIFLHNASLPSKTEEHTPLFQLSRYFRPSETLRYFRDTSHNEQKVQTAGNTPLWEPLRNSQTGFKSWVQFIFSTHYVFLKVLEKVQLTLAEWLLFVSEPGSMEDVFQRLFIPLDCEFLVAQWQSDGTVQLTEVYHISSRSTLEQHDVGNWCPRQGLQWRTIGFYKRRKNLRGLALRVVVSEVRLPVYVSVKRCTNKCGAQSWH
jgi:hypothetical protein